MTRITSAASTEGDAALAFAAIGKYRAQVSKDLSSGIATEHTYRPALKDLLESLAPKVTATNEPKRVAFGAPDFNISVPSPHGPQTIGYVETKDVGLALLVLESSEQIQRYLRGFSNFVLTDYIHFRWYKNGVLFEEARLGTPATIGTPSKPADEAVEALLQAFLTVAPVPVNSAEDLAGRLAKLASLVRDMIYDQLTAGTASPTMTDLRDAIRKGLVPDLDDTKFADMFAQTMAYGLFAARVGHTSASAFTRSDASRDLPKTNPFLRTLFQTVGGALLDDEPFVGYVDDLAQLLDRTNITSVLKDFGKHTRHEDPVVHFYETFLKAYDPELRDTAGVFYTPWPVVKFMVRSVDEVLVSSFSLPDGLGDTAKTTYRPPKGGDVSVPRVLVLDPATGTATYLYAIVDLIRERFAKSGNVGLWQSYVRDELLPRLFGFEFLMAPYAIAHLKLGLQLSGQDLPPASRKGFEYVFDANDRLGIYLTNTLEKAVLSSGVLFGGFITAEANAAADIKQDKPVMVVIGNPPYKGHSSNTSTWIRGLVDDYTKGIPGLDRPAQAKWLQDDYVKFLRFGEHRISQTGAGILAFITNHGFLDNPTFRGMRRHLLGTFSDIYVLNLHGHSVRRERAPGGGRDENVFDIRQGVAITIFVRRSDHAGPGRVHYQDLWGPRKNKYDWLEANTWKSTKYESVTPADPSYLFVPTDAARDAEFASNLSVAQIFNGTGAPAPGVVTTQDEFAISWSTADVEAKVKAFVATADEAAARKLWRLCSTTQWNYAEAKKALAGTGWREKLTQILHRPFDYRTTVLDKHVAVHRRERVMRHMTGGKNLALATTQTVEIADGFEHAFATRHAISHHGVSSKEVDYLFPLYVYPSEDEVAGGLFASTDIRPSISDEASAQLKARLGLTLVPSGAGDLRTTVGPEDVFSYVYATLYSDGYRARYAAQLRRDFPRIPITIDRDLFADLVGLGYRLVELHLDESVPLPAFVTYPAAGKDVIDKGFPRYVGPGELGRDGKVVPIGRVYINGALSGSQHFDNLAPEVWSYSIGGYQILDRWIRDRAGIPLKAADLASFRRIATAIESTIGLVEQVDDVIDASGGWPLPI